MFESSANRTRWSGMDLWRIVLFLFSLSCILLAHGQLQTGYISIDCGAQDGLNYNDFRTGIPYTSDQGYVDSGVSRNVSTEYGYPQNPTLPLQLSDLRCFPEGNKNCYAIQPAGGNGSLNLIRAVFLYGNYDNRSMLPSFDLYVDVNLWETVQFRDAGDIVTKEIISTAVSDTIYICLVNTGQGVPFISALELRPLNRSIYPTELGSLGSLVLFERLNVGSYNRSGRYRDDIYDRIWRPYIPTSWVPINTPFVVDTGGDGYRAPQEVLKTAARPRRGTGSLEVRWNTSEPDSKFFIYMYFAEFSDLAANQSRKMNVIWNGSPLLTGFSPSDLFSTVFSNRRALEGAEHQILINRTADSTFPPILNAIEIYMSKEAVEFLTYDQDVRAILDVKRAYNIGAKWSGDPCGPKNYSFEGVTCRFSGSSQPRIVSLNMSSSLLNGGIVSSMRRLSLLTSLDLSNNNLTGSVPGFLSDLQFLKYLNLKGNNLSDLVPKTLIDRSNRGLLTLSIDDRNLCGKESCEKNRNIILPIVASVAAFLVLVFALLATWTIRRRNLGFFRINGKLLAGKKAPFSYSQIVIITKNFQTVLGRGGFGTVYHGCLSNGTQVAVKILSSTSSQGPKEFQNEAEVLMRIHHKNLTSFIGYCEYKRLALVYEYMANGNLKNSLSADNPHPLSWEQRLRIAVDAAEGLQYLHRDCKPSIVHRDVKTENILLNDKLVAKISDFGLSRIFPDDDNLAHVSTAVMGTRGYLDPEYFISERLTEKSDVYSFGVVLLELLTGKPAIIRIGEQMHITAWLGRVVEEGELSDVVDPCLQGEFDPKSVRKFLDIAEACTVPSSDDRVAMDFVVTELKECLALELARERWLGRTSSTTISTEIFSNSVITVSSNSFVRQR